MYAELERCIIWCQLGYRQLRTIGGSYNTPSLPRFRTTHCSNQRKSSHTWPHIKTSLFIYFVILFLFTFLSDWRTHHMPVKSYPPPPPKKPENNPALHALPCAAVRCTSNLVPNIDTTTTTTTTTTANNNNQCTPFRVALCTEDGPATSAVAWWKPARATKTYCSRADHATLATGSLKPKP